MDSTRLWTHNFQLGLFIFHYILFIAHVRGHFLKTHKKWQKYGYNAKYKLNWKLCHHVLVLLLSGSYCIGFAPGQYVLVMGVYSDLVIIAMGEESMFSPKISLILKTHDFGYTGMYGFLHPFIFSYLVLIIWILGISEPWHQTALTDSLPIQNKIFNIPTSAFNRVCLLELNSFCPNFQT